MAEFEPGNLLLVLLDLVVYFLFVGFFCVCALSFIFYCNMEEKIKGREIEMPAIL